VVSNPIEQAVNGQNLVDPDGNLVWTAEQLGIMLGR
jgi:6-phosphofructokinase 1